MNLILMIAKFREKSTRDAKEFLNRVDSIDPTQKCYCWPKGNLLATLPRWSVERLNCEFMVEQSSPIVQKTLQKTAST
jgi:hypothetical protein